MGYLATEIIVLLGGAAVLGLIIGWALFGLGKNAVAAGAPANIRVDGDIKAERDARKKAEGRILELEAKESNFGERLQERDTKVAELSHQLDDLSKYRVQSAAEIDSRDQKITALQGQLKQLADATPTSYGKQAPATDDKLAERDRTIAKLKADLEAAQSAPGEVGGENHRIRELERENAELRQTLIATDGAAPTTSTEKDAAIARLNEEVTGLRAAYESAEQALEEQDAAIDKLTRDLQATQHKLAQNVPGDGVKHAASGPISTVKPRPEVKVEPPKPAVSPAVAVSPVVANKPVSSSATMVGTPAVSAAVFGGKLAGGGAPTKSGPIKAPAPVVNDEATVAVSLADLVGQIDEKLDQKPATIAADDATMSNLSFADLVGKSSSAKPPAPPPDNESTVAVSLADLVGQIDQKSGTAPAPAKPVPPPAPPKPVTASAPPPAMPESESTMALSLADLVDQIDEKAAQSPALTFAAKPADKPVIPPPSKPAAPAAMPESESTMALSLDALVAQIDERAATPTLSFGTPTPPPPAAVEVNESTVAVSLADLVGQIDSSASDVRQGQGFAPGPAGRQDDLKEIRGVGPSTEKRLKSAGIKTWSQVAGLSEAELLQVADLLKISVDKIKREQWVEQARALGMKG